MKKVAALYICTGKYVAFWPEFYESAEKFLLKSCEVEYFVFTDAETLPAGADDPKVHVLYQEAYPWPFGTLKRFEIFLRREEELKAFDYIFFFNANAQFMQPITEAEFLPRIEKGERLLVVRHPGFYNLPNYEYTYDRNPRSSAFIPMGLGRYYVCGGINGGTSQAFLKLCHTLNDRINRDLKRDVIALWHDESQINRYILFRHDCRVLHPGYCWPEEDYHLPYPCMILIRSKARYFDVQALRRGAPETPLPPAAAFCNKWMKRAARRWQRIFPPKGRD